VARAAGPGKAQQKANYRFLINNGRANINWQNWFLDQKNDFVMDRFPCPSSRSTRPTWPNWA
jgi:hypothetical protein